MAAIAPQLRGRFIVLDGPDGAGKTTQQKRLAESLEAAGLDVVTCRDPGGTEIGDRIRAVLLDHDLTHMDPTCETLLFMASRAQLLDEVIRPALAADKTVLCDRFGVKALDFDGRSDCLYHSYDRAGQRHMEYLRHHGHFADFPLDKMAAAFREAYPHFFDAEGMPAGDFDEDAPHRPDSPE